MLEKVKKIIKKYEMCPPGALVVAGVSGGADSIALLHILHRLEKAEGFSLIAVHVHHGLRGWEADRDAAFVEEICAQWGIPCKMFRYDVRKEAKERGRGEEETGRMLRYAAFRELAGAEGRVAVAHHADDQAETLLMHLCRGAGLRGLTGMAPLRNGILRPLLSCTRREIEEYCTENQLQFCQDSTNEETLYTRNRVRLTVFPLLEELYPSAAVHMANTAVILREDEEYLDKQAEEIFQCLTSGTDNRVSLQIEKLCALHPAMKKRVLQRALAQLGGGKDISALHWALLADLAEKETGKEIHLPYGVTARREYATLILEKEVKKQTDFCYPLDLGKEIWVAEGDFWVEATLFDEKDFENREDGCTNVFDYDKIKHTLFCRNRRAGDRILLSVGQKKLKDYCIDNKIPRGERGKIPLITAGEEVLWMVGERVSIGYAADEDTKRFLSVRIRRGMEQ